MAGSFDLSARITADASGLVNAARSGEGAVKGLEAAERRLASAGSELDVAQTRVAGSTARTSGEQAKLATALRDAETRLAAAQRELARYGKTQGDVAAISNRQAFATRNLGQQFGDFATQVALGGGVARAFAAQAGQAGLALADMGGRLGRVGAFLTGPWGIALTTAAVLLAPLVEKLFEGGSAADEFYDKASKAATAADSFGNAQSLLSKIIDTTTGALKTQNVVLIESIRLQALAGIAKAKNDQIASRDALNAAGRSNRVAGVDVGTGIGGTLATIYGASQGIGSSNDNAAVTRIADAYRSGAINVTQFRKQIVGLGLDAEKTNNILLKGIAYGTALNDERANQQVIDAIDGKGIAKDLIPYSRGRKPPKPKKPPSTVARDEFGEDAADRLANLRDSLSDIPAGVRQVNQQLRQLDDLIDDLARKKPLGFEKLIADAKALKPLIQDSINKPYNDYIQAQKQSLAIGELTLQGRVDEANALREIQRIEQQRGPLTEAQKAAILATNQAIREQGRLIDENRQKNQKYLEAIGSIKGIVEDATQAFVRGDLGQLIKAPGKLVEVFQTLQARKIFDSLFGDIFRELEDQVNGTATVRNASDRMAQAVDVASSAIGRLGAAADAAAGKVAGTGGGGTTTTDPTTGDVVVTGKRDPIAASITKVATKIGDVLGVKDPSKFGATVGKFAGKALGGAATGATVAGIGKALGLKTSSTGGQIGGAIGSFLPIPGGDIIGSIIGSVVGGLFKTTKKGSATIGNVNGAAGVTGTVGNSGSYKAAASALGGAVGDAINSIVQQLGGTLGNFAVSIGKKGDKFVVDASGRGSTKTGRANDGIVAYKTEAEAQAAALRDAILDGAIGGISAAMTRALKENADVNRAVSEALKVREIETLIGGLGGQLKRVFDDQVRNAEDRLRVAKRYGLDVVAVEKANAEERAKLIEDTLKARIGSLSAFLDNLKFGDLAEGSASEIRAALLESIKKATADAEAGKDGAADTLAQLYQQLVSTSRDQFGTAGPEYTTDRANAQSAVERVIEMERARVNEAAGLTTAAVEKVAVGVDESNDLLAAINTRLDNTNALLANLFGSGASSVDYGSTTRGSVYSTLQSS